MRKSLRMQECFSKIAKTWNEYCGDCLFDKDDVASMVAIAKIFMNKDNVVLYIGAGDLSDEEK